MHELLKYEFDFEFEIPATYPATAPEIQLPELDGKTAKMYRGGKICLTVHFKPLWAKNRCADLLSDLISIPTKFQCQPQGALVFCTGGACWLLHHICESNAANQETSHFFACSPHFGLAHALCLGLAPWLAAEVPHLVRHCHCSKHAVIMQASIHSSCGLQPERVFCPVILPLQQRLSAACRSRQAC